MIRSNLLTGGAPDVDTVSSTTYTFAKDYDEVYIALSKVMGGSSYIQGTATCVYTGTGTEENLASYLPTGGADIRCAYCYKHITNVKANDTVVLTALQGGTGTPTSKIIMIGF